MNNPAQKLLEMCRRGHKRFYTVDRDGYPDPVDMCAKWKTRFWESGGISHQEYYGRLDPDVQCSCGADQFNAELERLIEEIKTTPCLSL